MSTELPAPKFHHFERVLIRGDEPHSAQPLNLPQGAMAGYNAGRPMRAWRPAGETAAGRC
jgi:hypothetical protein